VRRLAPSLVVVNFDLPYTVSGIADHHYYGTGVIVDAAKGLVLVDRNTVPVAMGDVSITFAGSLEVEGKVEFVHPLHNLAIVSYDPALIGDTPARAVEFNIESLLPGDEAWVVGLKSDHRLVHQATTVASVDPVVLPLSNTLRFRDSNLEAISLVTAPEVDGVLVDRKGRVRALWSSFSYQNGGGSGQFNSGVPAELIKEFVNIVRSQKTIYSLEAEFDYAPLFAARKRGMDEEWLQRLEQHNEDKRSVLTIARIVGGSPAAEALRNGDMLLAVDGQVVTSFRELERAVQKPSVEITVWRDSKALNLTIATVPLSGKSIERAVVWAGALLQDPHRAIAAQRGINPEGVYVAFYNYGSPATRYGLWAGRRIVEVDGMPVSNLQSFVDAVKGKQDQASVRLGTVSWNGAKEVITLKLDQQYWPAYEVVLTDSGWQRFDID
jgi:S1-C subfamily serine protease